MRPIPFLQCTPSGNLMMHTCDLMFPQPTRDIEGLLSMGMEYTLLTDQYRMHPCISAFPSWRFYRGDLKNAVTDADRQLPSGLPFRSPLCFLHVDAIESSGGASKKNEQEADCAAWIVEQVTQAGIRPENIGIISPYGAQAGLSKGLRRWHFVIQPGQYELGALALQVKLIQRSLPYNAQLSVQVSTVDAFQGSEREVIILSLVRANRRGDVGFVADWRRLNVALSRAKRLCVVIGPGLSRALIDRTDGKKEQQQCSGRGHVCES